MIRFAHGVSIRMRDQYLKSFQFSWYDFRYDLNSTCNDGVWLALIWTVAMDGSIATAHVFMNLPDKTAHTKTFATFNHVSRDDFTALCTYDTKYIHPTNQLLKQTSNGE